MAETDIGRSHATSSLAFSPLSTQSIAAELGYEVTAVKNATASYSDEEIHAALDINIPNYASSNSPPFQIKVPKAQTVAAMEAVDRGGPLPPENKDHPLMGPWKGFRDCHVHSDLVLIYKRRGRDELILTRLGFHSELFG